MDELLNETYIIERDYNGELIDETADPADYIRINTEAVIIA